MCLGISHQLVHCENFVERMGKKMDLKNVGFSAHASKPLSFHQHGVNRED